jgi:hypothetical protein
MKDAREWDEDYLLNLPNGEYDWLEIKGRRGLDLSCQDVDEKHIRDLLSKAISAFANTGGGKLVVGLTQSVSGWAVDDGGVSLDMRKPTTREWLEDVIPHLVDFPLTSFNVYCVQRSSEQSQIAKGRGVFIIDIGEGNSAPHQATDQKYYARIAGKSRPIPHRLVLDIMGRRKDPRIELAFRIDAEVFAPLDPLGFSIPSSMPFETMPPREKTRKVTLRIAAENTGLVLARFVFCRVELPGQMMGEAKRKYLAEYIHEIDGVGYLPIINENTERDIVRGGGPFGPTEYGPTHYDPILPGLRRVWEQHLRPDLQSQDAEDLKIYWTTQADNSAPLKGEVFIRDIPFNVKEGD